MKFCLLLIMLTALAWSNIACSTTDAPATGTAGVPPAPAVPEGLGVNIHFTDPKPGEMKMLAEAGFAIVRMDFSWEGTEKARGQYDFAPYDRLLAAIEKCHLRTLFILDYGNKLYDDGNSPHSDEGRKAFATWAAAAVRHFKGKNILWEMWNEPNIGFWTPNPNTDNYIQLALEVGKAIRRAEPNEQYVGPATSGMDFPFLEACFQAGLLEYWSAVSVHPYRQNEPESVVADYAQLRRLIDKHAPKGKVIPILSGEWGYSAAWGRFDVDRQGKFLPRQWMMNLACGVPVSIWYDWHDDGVDPKEPEHHFGTVLYPYDADANPVYQPKPAYKAAKTLTTCLAGFRFNKRLSVGDANDYVLLFRKGDDVRLAVWTISKTPHSILVPASPGKFTVTGHLGEAMPPLTAQAMPALAPDGSGLSVTATDAPQYLAPDAPNDLLRLAAACEILPMEKYVPASPSVDVKLSVTNPLQRPVRVVIDGNTVELAPGAALPLKRRIQLLRNAQPVPVRLACHVEGMGVFAQEMTLLASNPLWAKITPVLGKELPVSVENPSGEPFVGTILLADAEGLEPVLTKAKLDFASGQTEKTVRFTLKKPVEATYRVGAVIEDAKGKPQVVLPATTFAPMDNFARYNANSLAEAYKTVADGDAKVAGTVSVSVGAPADGAPATGLGTLKIVYNLDKGWKFARLVPTRDAVRKIDGKPKFFGLWVYSDGSGNSPRLRFLDATGQCFQPTAESLKWKKWRFITFPMTGANIGHWGGADDGVIHYPIRWDTLFLLDKPNEQAVRGEVFIAGPVLIR